MFGDHCANCHKFGKEGGEQGPDLTGYGTADWLRLMVMAPDHFVRFGKKNTMPAFRNLEGPGGEVAKFEFSEFYNKKDDDKREPQVQHLSDVDREMIIRFLTGDMRAVFGGAPIK